MPGQSASSRQCTVHVLICADLSVSRAVQLADTLTGHIPLFFPEGQIQEKKAQLVKRSNDQQIFIISHGETISRSC
jgi:hypothetical protein